jgi:cellulose biosynthesis protein BcsQ
MNIGFVAPTGNLGKSTVCINFTIAFLHKYQNSKLRIIDADDRQKSLTKLMQIRKEKDFKSINVISTDEEINEVINTKGTINIIDTKGYLGKKEAEILKKLDLAIVVTNNEYLVTDKTIEYCESLDKAGIKYKVLVNEFDEKEGYSFEELKGIYKNHLMNTTIKNRTGYKKLIKDGISEYEKFMNGAFQLWRVRDEMESLMEEIVSFIKKK